MAWLTYKLFLLAATVTSCGLAYVPNSNLKCECTCSPINNPAAKYSAVGNFEAAIKPKSDSGTSFKATTEAVASLENKVPTVPTILKDSPFKVQNDPKLDIFSYKDGNNKQSTSYEIKKETSIPLVQRYSSRPVPYSSRSTTHGLVSPTSASILPNSPIELKVTSSAFRKAMRTVSNNSTEPKERKLPKELIDTKRIDELTKTDALTLDDIIFGKVPFDFGSRGIQRNFLTERETKALKDERSAQKTSTMNASVTTKRSTTGTATPETVANEFTASERAASETSTPVKKSTENSVQPETPTATTQSSTTTIITTTSAPTTISTTTTATTTTTTMAPTTAPTTFKTFKPISRRGLLPLFRTGYSPFTPAKTEKSVTVINATMPSTESSTEPTTSQPSPKTTTTSTTQKITTPSSTTEKPTTKAPTTTTTTTTPQPTTVTTQKPTTRRRRPETQRQSLYNVNPSSPPARSNTMQRKDLPVISANQVNPTYRFSDSFRKNTIRNLLDAFKPEYMKTLHEEEATTKPRPKKTESRQQHYVPPPPSHYSPVMQREMDIPFGHFEKTRSVDVPNHQLVHSMSSLSSMNSLQSSNSRKPALVVLDSPAQEQQHVSYQLRDQHTQQEPSWNPIQEPKKWGEPPKNWAQENQQQQLQQQSMNLQNHQLWNPHQNSIQKTQVFNPSFAMSGQTKQQQQQRQRQGAFPGLQMNKSPIDFRVH